LRPGQARAQEEEVGQEHDDADNQQVDQPFDHDADDSQRNCGND
jgi:hypothetical protein